MKFYCIWCNFSAEKPKWHICNGKRSIGLWEQKKMILWEPISLDRDEYQLIFIPRDKKGLNKTVV